MKSREEIISGNYSYFLESGAPYVTARAAEPSCIERHDGRVPNLLRELWRSHGFGVSHKGLIQLCDPEEFAPNLEEVLGGDPDFKPSESFVYAYTAFGRLEIWNGRWGSISINLPLRRVVPLHADRPPEELDWDRRMSSCLAALGSSTCDQRDVNGEPMFAHAVRELGPPAFGEVYGLFPALGLGGAYALKHLRRVRAAEHFSLLCQLGPFVLIDAASYPARTVRQIGQSLA